MLGLSKRQILAQSRINSSAIEMAAMKELPASPLNEAPPPITPKSDSRQIVVRRFSQKKVAFVKKNKPNRRTQPQTDGQSTSQPQTPLPAPPDQPSPSTAVNELISEYEHLSSPTFPEPPHTNSTRTSYSSSAHATEATITIQPSPSLRAMQSIALDTSPAPTNTTWRHSTRYFSPSQTSLAPEVHIPSGCPPWLADSLRSGTRSPAPLRLIVTNLPPEDEDDEDTVYGPSPQDMDDLIQRQRTWDGIEGGRVRSKIERMVSLGKEVAGGLRRRLSLKRGFEARVERKGSEKRVEGVRRGHAIVGIGGR
jgi:hypothetical protein